MQQFRLQNKNLLKSVYSLSSFPLSYFYKKQKYQFIGLFYEKHSPFFYKHSPTFKTYEMLCQKKKLLNANHLCPYLL